MDTLQYQTAAALKGDKSKVLNLVINGYPSILNDLICIIMLHFVLNLVINGYPSILL